MIARIYNDKVGAWVTIECNYDLKAYIRHLLSLKKECEELRIKAIQYCYGKYCVIIFHDFNVDKYMEMERARWEKEVCA